MNNIFLQIFLSTCMVAFAQGDKPVSDYYENRTKGVLEQALEKGSNQVLCGRIKIKEGAEKEVALWFETLNSRKEELLEAFAAEGVWLESVFLEHAQDGDYLIYYTRQDDLEKVYTILGQLGMPIRLFHVECWKKCCEECIVLEPLFDLRRKKPLESFQILDLTHPLTAAAPTWNGSCGFCLEVKKDYDQIFRVQQIKMHAGVGTHMDAPSHRFPDGQSIDTLALENFIIPACVVDVSQKADADYEISVQDIEDYEKKYGTIPPNALVIGYTGWDRFWSDANAYRNEQEGQMHFPAFSAAAAERLLQRNIAGIAIDTLSPDCLDTTYPVHKLLLGAGKWIIENIANGSEIPAQGATVIALPMRAENATESPVRVIALVPDK